MRYLTLATRPRVQVWVSGVSLAAWAALSPIAMLTGLKSALWWITFMSLFANVATCFGWWVSSLVNARTERVEANTDSLSHFERIESLEQEQARQGREHGAALAEILGWIRDQPVAEQEQPGPKIFPPRPPVTPAG